ncbi:hypothetical protein Tco_0340753 [Tanacetum coccineum]
MMVMTGGAMEMKVVNRGCSGDRNEGDCGVVDEMMLVVVWPAFGVAGKVGPVDWMRQICYEIEKRWKREWAGL